MSKIGSFTILYGIYAVQLTDQTQLTSVISFMSNQMVNGQSIGVKDRMIGGIWIG